jgi:hypothetical protein
MNEQNNFSKGRIIAGWVLVGLLGALFLFSAFMKLKGGEEMAAGFDKFGLKGKELLIGVGELLTIILFIIPRTSSLGVLLLSAYVGGAIVTHMANGESYVFPSVLLVVVWIANWLRNPEMLASFTKR